jgi:hypothetical protein
MDSKPHEGTATDLQVLATLVMATSTETALRRAQAELETRREVWTSRNPLAPNPYGAIRSSHHPTEVQILGCTSNHEEEKSY